MDSRAVPAGAGGRPRPGPGRPASSGRRAAAGSHVRLPRRAGGARGQGRERDALQGRRRHRDHPVPGRRQPHRPQDDFFGIA
ncbi:MAG: hypothetical protein DMF83_06965 [Acidobacteria bacterium]|nr:MAG: hypothetical protein DMF83_06965 [Acidobacteriota bacterium]